jgi:hypothetical protein
MPDFSRTGWGLQARQYGSLSGTPLIQTLPTQTLVVTEAPDQVVTTDEMKQFLGNVNNAVNNNLIDGLILAVTSQIERIVRYDMQPKVRRAYYPNAGYNLQLPYGIHGDIIEVKSIDEDGVETVLVEDVNYTVNGMTLKNVRLTNNVSGRYFTVEFQSGFATCPYELKQAVMQQVSMQYKNRQDPTVPLRMMENGLCPEAYSLVKSFAKIS